LCSILLAIIAYNAYNENEPAVEPIEKYKLFRKEYSKYYIPIKKEIEVK
jgi:hypothetical protein